MWVGWGAGSAPGAVMATPYLSRLRAWAWVDGQVSGRGPADASLAARTTGQRRGECRSIVARLPGLPERDGYAVE